MTGTEQEELAPWIKQTMGLAHVVAASGLPVPISVSWDPYDARLTVQVEEGGFRQWMTSVASPVLESTPHEDTLHLYATGELDRCRMVRVRVVAVCRNAKQVTG